MNIILKTGIFLLIILAVSSCNKEEEPSINPESNYLTGVWISPVYTDSTISFKRSAHLPENDYGLSLLSTGKLIERKNIGWCGTPPITYGDYEGNWSEKDSVVQINVGFWGGEAKLIWKVIAINNDFLKVKQLSIEFIEKN